MVNLDKKRIRMEEIYRAEVRRKLEAERNLNRWKMFVRALNSPFIIWILSSIGIGLVSFLYSQWAENESVRSANERQATKVFFEAQFRIDQMDEVLDNADTHLSATQDLTTKAMLLLFVGIKLGGITSFPLNDEINVWVNGSGNGNSKLPAGRGYQNQDFQGQSLLSLWYIYYSLTCNVRPSDERVSNLNLQFQSLKKIMRDNVDGKTQARKILEQAKDIWSRIKEKLTMFVHPGPRFDRVKYCE